MKNILFVEDNAHKRTRVVEYIESIAGDVCVDEAWSYTSGCRKIEIKDYDLYLLDVSLPTYDRTGSESGGRFRVFGGREVARKIFRLKATGKIAFITQFNSFSDKGNSYTFDALQLVIEKELKENYLGMVFYNSALSVWREELSKIVREI